VLSNKRFLLGV